MTIKFKKHYDTYQVNHYSVMVDGVKSDKLGLLKDNIFGGYAVIDLEDRGKWNGMTYVKKILLSADTQKEAREKLMVMLNK